MKKSNSKKGFTLVELVIVIAVIAILAAILVPTFATVIGKANKTKAESALRANITEFLAENPTAEAANAVDNATFQLTLNDETVYYSYNNGAITAANAPDEGETFAAFVGGNGDEFSIKWNNTEWKFGTTTDWSAKEVTEAP